MEEILNFTVLISSLRRRWWMPAIGIVVGAAAAFGIAHRLPKIYRASTLILVEPQKIPVAYVRPTVTTTIQDRLRSLQQQVTSRSRVERVIHDLGLFPDEIDTVPMETLVARVASRVTLDVRGGNTFRIIYEGTNPKEVALVANKMADLVIEENTAARQREAEGTSKFLDKELERVRGQLKQEEDAIAKFKRDHMGELPEQSDANLRSLESSQQRLRTVGESLSRARDRKYLLETQLAELPASGTSVNQVAVQLEQAKARLDDLLSRYTDKHPDVVQQKMEIQRLQALLDSGKSTDDQAAKDEKIEPEETPESTNTSPYANKLRSDIQAAAAEIKDLLMEEERLKGDIARYQQRVENAPRNEAILSTLTRDYDNMESNYQSLLNKKMEADLAEKLEHERRGEQFNIVDKAVPPAFPFKPNITQMIAFGCALGLMAGCALAIALDIFRPRFRTEDELAAAFNIPVLAAIPLVITTQAREKARRVRRIILGSGVAVAALAALVVAFLVTGG
ncbi:MAG TPA: XrtA system polysaccharide chain length determinant [Candidatus Saccharimonadales bacterium]|nr:XrtA system polysaccharide chain length determinant [Candidatus Saccharimonadales bacterium]